MLLVEPPNKKRLQKILADLLSGKLRRSEVVAWCLAAAEGDPWSVDLSVDDGYWVFQSLVLLDDKLQYGSTLQPFMRKSDIREHLEDLERVSCRERVGQVERIRSHQIKSRDRQNQKPWWPLQVIKGVPLDHFRKLGLGSVRGRFERGNDLVEHMHLRFRVVPDIPRLYLIVRQYDDQPEDVMVLGPDKDQYALERLLHNLQLPD